MARVWICSRHGESEAPCDCGQSLEYEKSADRARVRHGRSDWLGRLQKDVEEWELRNFGAVGAWQSLLGATEELGELCHGYLKELQMIRGKAEEHQAAQRDAIGDLLIYLINFCNKREWSVQAILEDTWAEVRQRDWIKYPETGMPVESRSREERLVASSVAELRRAAGRCLISHSGRGAVGTGACRTCRELSRVADGLESAAGRGDGAA